MWFVVRHELKIKQKFSGLFRTRASAGFWLEGSVPPWLLRRIKFWKFDYEMVHSEVYPDKYVVSIAPFSTPACPDCSLFAFNFSSIFPGGSADLICPYVRTPMVQNISRTELNWAPVQNPFIPTEVFTAHELVFTNFSCVQFSSRAVNKPLKAEAYGPFTHTLRVAVLRW